jgi:hypothetical protein
MSSVPGQSRPKGLTGGWIVGPDDECTFFRYDQHPRSATLVITGTGGWTGEGLVSMLGGWWPRVAVAVCLFALAGCGSPAPAPAAAPPAVRASNIGANPCALLTIGQQHQRGLNQGAQQPATDGLSEVSCVWSYVPVTPGDTLTGRVIRGPLPGATPSSSIVGLPTWQYVPADMDQKTSCIFLVDVAPDETLWVQYSNTSGDLPGLNHVVACRKVQNAAANMVSRYRSLPK